MIVRRGTGDLNKIYRPCRVDEIIGQETINNTITNALEKGTLPHSSLFTGPSGCGKTTFARIIALGLNCEKGRSPNPCCECDSCKSILNLNSLAVLEVDAARTSDVNTVRSILDDLPAAPLGAKYKVAIFDEAHNLSGKAEDALLKFLEDTPEHVYLILCTNIPQKLKVVTRNRCKTIQFGRLTNANIYALLEQVAQFEGFNYSKDVLRYIAEESEGVPRAALSHLQQISAEGSWTKDAASIIINAGIDLDNTAVINLSQRIIQGAKFNEILSILKTINIPPESTRIAMRGYFIGCLKKNPNQWHFFKMAEALREPYYSKSKPEHDLISDIYKVVRILRDLKTRGR
jgi:DNA polymerase-3 subunit gamma/tau